MLRLREGLVCNTINRLASWRGGYFNLEGKD